jgi:hypothetical protein
MHVVTFPLAVVFATVGPDVETTPVYHIIFEATYVHRSIVPFKSSRALLLSINILTLIDRVVWPVLNSVAVLFITIPVTFEGCAPYMHIDSITVSSIVQPLSFVEVSVEVDQSSFTICSVLSPVAFIPTTVPPNLYSSTVTLSLFVPLANVDYLVLELDWTTRNKISVFQFILIVNEWPEFIINHFDWRCEFR